MIPQDVEVFLALEPVNMHLSFERLAALVAERMGRSARDPALYIFLNRRRTLLKALFFDGTGLCQFYKRLDRGRFQLPEPVDDGRVVELSEAELEQLLDGLEPGARRRGESPPTLH
jgi:transposase